MISGAEFVVVEPTTDVEVQLVDDGLNVVSAIATGDFPNPLLEAVVRFVRPRELGPLVQSVAEELTGFEQRSAAFGAVDYQLQMSFAVSDQRCHHSFRGVRAFHHDDEVVGISRELVSACF